MRDETTTGGLSRRTVLQGGIAMGTVALLLGPGCSSDEEGATATTAGGGGDGGSTLLDDLARDGDTAVLDQTFSVTGGGSEPALVVGTSGEEAVAYLCDPAGPHLWFSGTTDGTTVELTSDGGGRATGTIDGDELSVTLADTGGHDGSFTLAASDAVSLVPQVDEDGARVGGLIVDGTVVTGSMRGTLESSELDRPVTVGVRAIAEDVADLFVVVSSDSGEFREQAEPLRAALEQVQPQVVEIQQRVLEAARGEGVISECARTVTLLGALATLSTNVALRVIDGVLVGEDVEGESLVARLGDEVLPIVGDEAALTEFVERNDPTFDAAIANTMRRRLEAVRGLEQETPATGNVDLATA